MLSPTDPDATPATLAPDPDEEPTPRERLAARIEARLDIPMAVLAVVWALLIAYELIAPEAHRPALTMAGNVIWGVFLAEFVLKLWVSRNPLRFLRRRWPSVLFLVLPALRFFRVLRAVRAIRLLPAARVVGSSYRAVGTARNLLKDRVIFLLATTAIAVWGGAQLLYLTERGREGGVETLGEALWWSASLAIGNNMVFEPVSLLGKLLAILLSAYAVIVFASIAAALGAFFVEARAERAATERAGESL